MTKACKATRTNRQPCQAPAGEDGYCFCHSPRLAVELAALAGLTLDPWQRDALTSTAPRCLWNASRQAGKSTTAALLALWTVLSRPGALVLVVSPSEEQSRELFRRAIGVYRLLSVDGAYAIRPAAETN